MNSLPVTSTPAAGRPATRAARRFGAFAALTASPGALAAAPPSSKAELEALTVLSALTARLASIPAFLGTALAAGQHCSAQHCSEQCRPRTVCPEQKR